MQGPQACTNGDGSPSKKPKGPDVPYGVELATRGSMQRRVGGGLPSCLPACPVRGLGVSGPLESKKAEPFQNLLSFPSISHSEIKATFGLLLRM